MTAPRCRFQPIDAWEDALSSITSTMTIAMTRRPARLRSMPSARHGVEYLATGRAAQVDMTFE
jgi:hypothetical protein